MARLYANPYAKVMATFRQRCGRWQAQVRRHGQCLSGTFDTKAAARAWARRTEADLDQGKAIGHPSRVGGTVGDLLGAYEVELRKVRPIRRSKEQVLKQLRDGLGDVPLRRLTSERVLEHARKRRQGGAGVVTVGLDLSLLGTVLRASHGLLGTRLSVEPVQQAREALSGAGLLGKSQERDRRPTQEEIERLCDHFAGKARQRLPMPNLIRFAIATAMRREEVTRLRWADLDQERGLVLIRDRKDPRRKAGNDELVPLLAVTGYDALDLALAQPETGPLIWPWSPDTITTTFARACNALGIDDLRWHDFRHHGISLMFEAGMGLQEVALISGHKDWRTLRRYTHIRPADLARRWRGVPPG